MIDDKPTSKTQLPTESVGRSDGSATSLVLERLGDFELIREIGRGGMGVVYEARQLSLNRRVALKVLPPGLGLTREARIRFEREARAAAKLHHTNIVPVHAIGEQDGHHFYAMELIEGKSLAAVLDEMTLMGNTIMNVTVPAAVAAAMGKMPPQKAAEVAAANAPLTTGISGARVRAEKVAELAVKIMG